MNLKVFEILATGTVSMLLNVAVAQQSNTILGNDIHDATIHHDTRPGYVILAN